MPSQSWRQVIASQQAQGTLFNTYTTAKTVINPQALVTLPAGFFGQVGQRLTIEVWGGESHRVTGPDTMTFQVMLGSVVAFTTGALNLTTTAHTTIPFYCKIDLTLNSVGSGTSAKFLGQAVIWGQGFAMAASLADNAAATGMAIGPNTAPAVGTGFDATAAQVLDFWVGQSFSGAGNGIQVAAYAASSDN